MSETVKPSTTLSVLTNALIVAAMATCVAVALVQFGQQIIPSWNAGYIPAVCFFVALEVAITTRSLHVAQARLPAPWYVLRAIEVMIIFLGARALLGFIRGPDFVVKYDPFYGGTDNELLALVFVVGVIWLIGWQFTRCLLDLESSDPADRELMQDLDRSQQAARQSLVTTIMLIGVPMVLISAVQRMSLRNAGQATEAAQLSVAQLLIFFVLGLILLSKTRLAVLRSGWQWERVPIGAGLSARWIGYSVALVAALLLIAIVLPTQYSVGLLGTLGYLLTLIIALAEFVFLTIAALIAALFSLLFPQVAREPRPMPAFPTLPPLTPTQVTPPTISEFAQSLIFWVVFVGVIVYLVRQYARQHPALEELLQRLPGWSIFGRWWRRLRELFGGLSAKITATLEARRQLRSVPPTRSSLKINRWVNVRRLSPREQVRFYYHALLRRGSERGYPRRSAQTPNEYARDLVASVPELDQEVAAMTDHFSEARYSGHEITPERVGVVRRAWDRIKRTLRRR